MLRFIYRVYPSRSASGYLEVKLFLARGDSDETFQGSVSMSVIEWRAYKKLINYGDTSMTSKRTWLEAFGERIDASLTIIENFSSHEI